ncbi:hypothetical protein ACFLV5_00500 [Chloroflexota bacterium]
MSVFGVDATLRQRGFLIVSRGDYEQTIAPDGMQPNKMLSSGNCLPDWDKDFYQRMSRISLRKMFRYMLAHPDGALKEELSSELSQASSSIGERLSYLRKTGLVREHDKGRWCLKKSFNNFGPTFERYVKSIFEREFFWFAEWGITLEDFSDGDFDVLASTGSVLCYVECKTARPEDVSDRELRHFLERSQDLAPEIAILLIDTEDSLEKPLEKLENILILINRKSLAMPNWKPEEPFFTEPGGFRGVYFGCRRIFITNAKPNVVRNLRLCLRF